MATSKSSKKDIKKAPSENVTDLAKIEKTKTGTRSVFKTSWKYSDASFSSDKEDRFEGVMCQWIVDEKMNDGTSRVSSKKKVYSSAKKKYVTKKTNTQNITNADIRRNFLHRLAGKSKTSDSLDLPRSAFYPFRGGKKDVNVKIYKVKSAKKVGNRWRMSSKLIMTMSRVSVKKSNIKSMKELATGSENPTGKYMYKSLTNKKHLSKGVVYKPKVDGIGVRIQGWNKCSKAPKGKTATKSNVIWNDNAPTKALYYNLKKPTAPKISYSVGGEGTNYLVTFTIENDDDSKTRAERYDTSYVVYEAYGVYTADGSKYTHSKKKIVYKGSDGKEKKGTNTNKKFKVSVSPNVVYRRVTGATSIAEIKEGEYVQFQIDAYNRGFSGDSKHAKTSSGTLYTVTIARPRRTRITGIKEVDDFYVISFTSLAERTKLKTESYIDKKTKKKKTRKVTVADTKDVTSSYTLYRLTNYRPSPSGNAVNVDDWSDAQWKEAAANEPDSSWTKVYTVGPDIYSFTDNKYKAYADPYKRTYYRVTGNNKLYMLGDGIPSEPVVVPGYLHIPSAKDITTEIRHASCTPDGKAIMTVVCFNKEKTADEENVNSNGTEMSWDTETYAWQSSSPPNTYDFMDDTVPTYMVTQELLNDTTKSARLYFNQSDINKSFATYYLRGIETMSKYYVKARRFLKDADGRESDSYGGYAAFGESGEGGVATTIEVKGIAREVKISGPDRIVEGSDLSVTWTFDGDDEQEAYSLYYLGGTSDAAKSDATIFDEHNGRKDSAPYAVLRWEEFSDKIFENNIYLSVTVLIGSEWSTLADPIVVNVIKRPHASLNVPATVTSQPLRITLGTDDIGANPVVRILSQGYMGWGPTGNEDQPEGAIIKSVKIMQPKWEAGPVIDHVQWYSFDYTFDEDLDIRNGASYTIEYTAVNDENNLRSYVIDEETQEQVPNQGEFRVRWLDENKIAKPVFYVVADPRRASDTASQKEQHDGVVSVCIKGNKQGPNGAWTQQDGVVADIYRINRDGIQLIAYNIDQWANTTFTDLFPAYSKYVGTYSDHHGAIGEDYQLCKYRVALRSKNASTIWDDKPYRLDGYCIRFDWGESDYEQNGSYNHLVLPYNLKWSDSWTKNSRVELHMDGSYVGQWRKGVDRKSNISTEIVKFNGADQIARVISLAEHTGPVLVRVPDGGCFCADVQVSNLDVSYDSLTVSASFSAQEIIMNERFSTGSVEMTSGVLTPTA